MIVVRITRGELVGLGACAGGLALTFRSDDARDPKGDREGDEGATKDRAAQFVLAGATYAHAADMTRFATGCARELGVRIDVTPTTLGRLDHVMRGQLRRARAIELARDGHHAEGVIQPSAEDLARYGRP